MQCKPSNKWLLTIIPTFLNVQVGGAFSMHDVGRHSNGILAARMQIRRNLDSASPVGFPGFLREQDEKLNIY